MSLDLTGMLAGTKYRGDFEDRLKNVLKEVGKAKDVVLFIDELHTVIGAGAAEGALIGVITGLSMDLASPATPIFTIAPPPHGQGRERP